MNARIITDKTGMTIGLFAILSASLVTVGVYVNKVDTLVTQMKEVRTDLTAIRVRLGIPPAREVVAAMEAREGKVIPLSDAISRPPWTPRPTPLQSVSVPE